MFKGGSGGSPDITEVILRPGGAFFGFGIEMRVISSAVSSSSDGGACGGVVVGGCFIGFSEGLFGWCFASNLWGVTSVSFSPLCLDKVVEERPDLPLGFKHTGVGASWAVVDWHTSGKGVGEVLVVPASLEDKDDDHDVKDGKSDKNETEHLSTSESGDETSMAGIGASVGNSGVGVDSDSHSNVTGNDGGR